jgi:hypothetical protein
LIGLPRIGMLWMEGPLSYLEQLCIVSFRDAGHEVVLYHYGPLENVPEGVELADAATVLPRDGDGLTHARTGSPALHSDLFRYRLLRKEPGMIWADTDAYCMMPFDTESGHFYGWESKHHVNGGVLGLPADCDTLAALLEFTSDIHSIPPWYPENLKQEYNEAAKAGTPVPAGDMPWGVWGPHAITHFLHDTGEVKHAFPQHVLYPFTFADRRLMLRRGFDASDYVRPDTMSIHFYGRRMRKRLVEAEGGTPKRWSLIGKLLKKHNVDPAGAPIPVTSAPEQEPPAQAFRTLTEHPGKSANLTDLADYYGSDKGSNKHRYTELYNLLFHPFRDRKISFLEMGLQIGGPEHGKSEDRETTDLPSVRMWLDYFTKAQVFGLDVSEFSWFEAERFKFLRCDMDDRANIDEAASDLPMLDIAIDDASHASMHQQQAFLALWPKIKPGGMYIIEDLRWQPEVYENKHPGITKTADLFQSWITKRRFNHSDPSMTEAFNALAPEFSGCFLHQALFDKSRKDQVLVVQKR